MTADGRTDTPTQEDGHEAHGDHRRRHRGGRGSIGAVAVAVAANGRDEAPPAGTLTVDAQFPTPESGQLSANLADPKGSAKTDPAKIADLFAGNGKLFQGASRSAPCTSTTS